MKRIAPEHTYEQVVQAEVAHEILNRARGIIVAKIREARVTDPDRAEALMKKHIELFELQRSFDVTDDEVIARIIEEWGEKLKDRDSFVRSL